MAEWFFCLDTQIWLVDIQFFLNFFSMDIDFIGRHVSIYCGPSLGYFQGQIKSVNVSGQTLCIENPYKNGVKCDFPEITLSWVLCIMYKMFILRLFLKVNVLRICLRLTVISVKILQSVLQYIHHPLYCCTNTSSFIGNQIMSLWFLFLKNYF